MDGQTCPTCGCLIGDEQIHRDWHASARAGQPASGESPLPTDPENGPDPAPYSA